MILLVRHGETASNAARIVQTPEEPLSARGVLQAERLAARLAALGVDRVVSSDYLRARMTAESVCRACRAPVEFWPELRERNFGALRGRPYAECPADMFGPAYAPEGGETWEVFHERVRHAWRQVTAFAAQAPGNVAFLTHGLMCRSIVERCVGLGASESGGVLEGRQDETGRRSPRTIPTVWANTSLTIVSKGAPHELVLLNCAVHIADLVAAAGSMI